MDAGYLWGSESVVVSTCMLGSEDLNGGGRVLCEIGERACVGDEASCDRVPDQGLQIRRDELHLRLEILLWGKGWVRGKGAGVAVRVEGRGCGERERSCGERE